MASYLDHEGHRLVSGAVRAAELTTSGEIVTVLAERSDGYTDVVFAWCVAASFLAMGLFAAWPDTVLGWFDWLVGGWGANWSTSQVISICLAIGALTFALVWLAMLPARPRFTCIPGTIKTARVHERAIKHFKVGAEKRTHGRTGVLIYLSMLEHRAEIVADEPIAELVSADVWGEAMADMLVEIKKGRIAEGMAAGVRDVGAVLSEHFPRGDDDENELPDRLIEV